MTTKASWAGTVLSVQPRIRLLRSFDQCSDKYLGFTLRVRGRTDEEDREFTVGIGEEAQKKHEFRAGDVVAGTSVPVSDPRKDAVELYKTSALKLIERGPGEGEPAPPWTGSPPELAVYRERGHRRLSSRTYESKCLPCIWGSQMAVEMIIDHWNPGRKKYRLETFCYGPKSCRLYASGPTRKVPGRHGMTYEEEDRVDEDRTAHRGPDE